MVKTTEFRFNANEQLFKFVRKRDDIHIFTIQ